jgi:elongation factor G
VHGASVVLLEVRVEGGDFVEPLLQQAAAKALAAAIEQAGRVELEPWVQIEVWCPEDTSAAVLADLGSRGALVSGVSSGRLGAYLLGRAPLARMLGYVTRLRSLTRGRGQVSLQPAGFARMRA